MADRDSMGRGVGDPTTNLADDIRDQGWVLLNVLSLHPTSLRLSELIPAVCGGQPDFVERDRIERAVGELVVVGLLFRLDELVLPTLGALRFGAICEAEA